MPFTDDEELITEAEVSKLTKRSRRQLQRDRAARRGIPFVLLEWQVRYRRGDVRCHIEEATVRTERWRPQFKKSKIKTMEGVHE